MSLFEPHRFLKSFGVKEPYVEVDCLYNGIASKIFIDDEKLVVVKKPYRVEGFPHVKTYSLEEIKVEKIKKKKSLVKLYIASESFKFSLVLSPEELDKMLKTQSSFKI